MLFLQFNKQIVIIIFLMYFWTSSINSLLKDIAVGTLNTLVRIYGV